uniref:HTH cro/C1-type domain-containing protein n=1 Tax=Panagrolaimus davidi TaxID=227884 RepID=A0A914QEP9_9BILA
MSKMGRMESDTTQDSVTILRKSAPPIKTCRTTGEIAAAQRRGAEIETSKKFAAGSNVQHGMQKNALKLDNETEELHHERVSLSLGRAIQQGRQGKEMTQKDLATKICEKIQVVQEFESGKAIPNAQVLGKMERVLGIKLRGKDIGKPLGPPPAKTAAATKK